MPCYRLTKRQLKQPCKGRSQLSLRATRFKPTSKLVSTQSLSHSQQADRQTYQPATRTVLPAHQTGCTARTRNTSVSESRGVKVLLLARGPKLTFNDPSAGSPTETLLRLLLPLNASVWSSSRKTVSVSQLKHNPRTSLKRSIGSSDGRCVQRAGT